MSDAFSTIVVVECVRVEASGHHHPGLWNARFHARGLAGDSGPRGMVGLTRLPTKPVVGARYRLTLEAEGGLSRV
jgi:hypothetical protein